MRFESNERNSLLRIAFTRAGNYWSLQEDYFRRTLYLLSAQGSERANASDLRFDLDYLENGAPARYHYFGDAGSLTLRTRASWSELLLAEDNEVRFRGGRNTGLRFTLRSMVEGRGAAGLHSVARLHDGSVEAVFGSAGSVRFTALCGSLTLRADYDASAGRYACMEIDVLPDAEGRYECALLSYIGTASLPECRRGFDALREGNLRSLEAFAGHYRAIPERWQGLASELIYTVWGDVMRPQGFVEEPLIMMHRNCLSTALAWQQSYNGMSMLGDPV